ncbi:hypothetical protein WKK05_20735 [Nostoc sp. UHCC 0302]|uniref:hypothetical protein n=1 Tax=Nostoc sp. UHCC 0302 TaxID=3134896 RepID=UPI00311CB95B
MPLVSTTSATSTSLGTSARKSSEVEIQLPPVVLLWGSKLRVGGASRREASRS